VVLHCWTTDWDNGLGPPLVPIRDGNGIVIRLEDLSYLLLLGSGLAGTAKRPTPSYPRPFSRLSRTCNPWFPPLLLRLVRSY